MTWSLAPSEGRLSNLSTSRKGAGDSREMSDCQNCQDESGRKPIDEVLSSRKSGEVYGLVYPFDQESTKKNLFH